MKVSVIIPVYNTHAFLRDCVRSALSQEGCSDMEVIVVDDGSTDGSAGALRCFSGNDNLRLLRQEHIGPGAARNAGIEAAAGEWLLFLDADDVLLPRAISRLLNVVVREKVPVGIGRIVRKMPRMDSTTDVSEESVRCVDGARVVSWMLHQDRRFPYLGSFGGKIFHRDLFERLRFHPEMAYEDLALLPFVYLEAQKIAMMDVPVYYYRHNAASFINTWSPRRFDVFRAIDMLKSSGIGSYHEKIQRGLIDREFSAAMNILMLMDKYGADHKDYEEQCWRVITRNRWQVIDNCDTRLKNRLGALVSFGGKPLLRLLNRSLRLVR